MGYKKMETKKAKVENKNKFGVVEEKEYIFNSIIAEQDENLNVVKIVLQNDNLKVTWKPCIYKNDKSGLVPSRTKVTENIKQVDLPQIIHNIATIINNKGSVKVKCGMQSTTNEKGKTYYFFNDVDIDTLKIL